MESEKLLPCPNPWCAARTPPLPVQSRMASNGWHVACACGVRSWDKSTEAEAIAAWNTRAPAEQTGWQPIETAPKDGSLIDIWIAGCRETDVRFGRPEHSCGEYGRYCDSCPSYDGWVSSHCEHYLTGESGLYDDEPTHWMYPPAPPGTTRAPADLRSALEAETDGLVEMLKAAQDWDGIAVFEHSPEEIGLEVMEHYQAVLAALAPTKGDVS